MKDFDFFGDGRIEDGGILQTVAQRFVIESYFVARIEIDGRLKIPIVN